MRFPIKLMSIILILTMSACTSVKMVTEVDKDADFQKYKTYSFLGWQDDSDEKLPDIDKRRIRDAFMLEFEKRGLKHQEQGGDMEISLFIVLNEKKSVTAYTDYYNTGGYGRYYRYRGGWGHGYAETTFEENDYIEGTLVMDVFDSETQQQIWQGIATSTVVEDPQKREKTIPRKTRSLMNRFPFKSATK